MIFAKLFFLIFAIAYSFNIVLKSIRNQKIEPSDVLLMAASIAGFVWAIGLLE